MNVGEMTSGQDWPLVSGKDDTIIMSATPLNDANLDDHYNNHTIRIKLQTSNGCGGRKDLSQYDSNNFYVKEEIAVDGGAAEKDYAANTFQNPELTRWGLWKTGRDYFRIVNMNDLKPGFTYLIDWQRC